MGERSRTERTGFGIGGIWGGNGGKPVRQPPFRQTGRMRKTNGDSSFNRLPPERQPLSSVEPPPRKRIAAMNALNPTTSALRTLRPFQLAFPVRDIAEARKYRSEIT